MKQHKKQINICLFISLFVFNNVWASEINDATRAEKIFKDPSAYEIVVNHKQRLSNIDYELNEVQETINQYSAFRNRVNRVIKDEENKKIMKDLMDKQINTYWEIYKKYKDARDLLLNIPSFEVKH